MSNLENEAARRAMVPVPVCCGGAQEPSSCYSVSHQLCPEALPCLQNELENDRLKNQFHFIKHIN